MAGSKAGQSRSVAREGSSGGFIQQFVWCILNIYKGQPARKKARTTKAAAAGPKKRGKLSLAQFLDLPAEVIGEIVKHLVPADLLSLARSTKFLREIFMSRTSQALWKATIRNVPNMPDCPSGLCEPEYISLLHTKICSTCGAKALRPMDPYLLARLCSACSKETTQVIFAPSDPLYDLVVRSPMLSEWDIFSTAFNDDMVDIQEESSRHHPGSKWFKARKVAYGQKLKKFLDNLDKEKAAEIVGVKEQRRQEQDETETGTSRYYRDEDEEDERYDEEGLCTYEQHYGDGSEEGEEGNSEESVEMGDLTD
ncbi:hypothetical protein FRC09_002208 [Ceratobasidium sp. 395]|nr:hypothetical protein FRC09_002208 [Ceratobasidium sp. 395]